MRVELNTDSIKQKEKIFKIDSLICGKILTNEIKHTQGIQIEIDKSWIQTCSENPTVSYRQTLMQKVDGTMPPTYL